MDEIIGIQAVRAALRDTPARARTLYLMKGRRDARYNELIGMAREEGIRYQTVEDAWFKRRDFEVRIRAYCSSAIPARWRTSKRCKGVGRS